MSAREMERNGRTTTGPNEAQKTPDFTESTSDVAFEKIEYRPGLKKRVVEKLLEVNKELWIIFSLFVLTGLMNYLVASQRILLGLYTLPTLFSAYFFGRRHATLTALLSILMVGLLAYYNPSWLTMGWHVPEDKWRELLAWGGILLVTAYAMGTLYERDKEKMKELRETYRGVIIILRHFISNDKYTENHCYRVSIYAAKIAAYLGLPEEDIENIRSAALLHDIGKLEISRNILYKAAQLTKDEYENVKQHVDRGEELLEPLGGSLGKILPIILAHHEKYDGSGYKKVKGRDIPLGARILSVADAYDSMTSDRPYRKAISTFEARDLIAKMAGKEFDPKVVKAFLRAFAKGEMEVPNLVL